MNLQKRKLVSSIQSIPLRLRIYKICRAILVWLLFAATINLLLSYLFYTPKSYYMNIENKELVAEIYELNETISELNKETEKLRFRYDNVYKPMFGMQKELPMERVFEMSDQKYRNIYQDRYQKTVLEAHKTQDNLSQELVSLSYCLDSIASLALIKDSVLISIPQISPIKTENFIRISDKYGPRIHPIYKRPQFHRGIDIACKTNTPIYSPANGKVIRVTYERGYGRLVIINHDFGYITKYAHLNKYDVREGQTVKRGELIAFSGSTGGSTGPHLHYEVLLNGKNVNPINYISLEMSEAEYAKILESAQTDLTKTIDNVDTFGYK